MQVDVSEALRYLGVKAPDAALLETARSVAAELERAVSPQFTYRVLPVVHTDAGEQLPGTDLTLPGSMANKMLAECSHAALLLCTLGAPFEALLRRKQASDMAQAAILDACGSALVEVGCDEAEKAIAARFPEKFLTDRFSPGYGDLPLALQPQVCAALDARRRLGVTVTESLLMVPTKTVSAIIGLADTPQPARVRGCAYCNRRETCNLRKAGTPCTT